jgi:hypothetical protein
MPIGDFTRQRAEQRAIDQMNTAIAALFNLSQLAQRVRAELAAGTLDMPDWYGDPADPANTEGQRNRADFVGAMDEALAIFGWLMGGGDVPPPAGDPLAYAKSIIGLG